MRGKAAGDAEADDAAIALSCRAHYGRCQFAPRVAGKHEDAGTGRNPGLERHADESDDKASRLERSFGAWLGVLGETEQAIRKGGVGKLRFRRHELTMPPRV